MQGRPGSPRSPGKEGGNPKSPRRKRTLKNGRVDYATMEALADLNYAMHRGTYVALPSSSETQPYTCLHQQCCMQEQCCESLLEPHPEALGLTCRGTEYYSWHWSLWSIIHKYICPDLQRRRMVVGRGRSREQMQMTLSRQGRAQQMVGRAAVQLMLLPMVRGLSPQHQRRSAEQE